MKDLKNKGFLATIVVAIVMMFLYVLFYNQAFIFWGIFILFIGLGIFYIKPQVAFYIIAAIYPFTLFKFFYSNIDVQYVDIIALMLFITFVGKELVGLLQGKFQFDKKIFVGAGFYLAFIFASAISIFNVESYQIALSIKYLLRPLIFLYLMWIVLPLKFIKDQKTLLNIMKIMVFLGIFLAVGGLYKFIFFDSTEGLRRALPIVFGGFYPLGKNHNLLSETLIGIVPIAYLFYKINKDIFYKHLMMVITLFIAGVSFITFSRSGWLGLAAGITVILAIEYKQEIKDKYLKFISWLAVILVIPLAVILYIINMTSITHGSNLNRIDLINVSMDMFKIHPLFGAGVGTFISNVEQIQWYLVEYGSVIDSHSLFFKLLSETGMIGTILFYLFIGYIVFYILKNMLKIKDQIWVHISTSLLASSVGLFVFEMFGTSYFLAKMWLFIGLTLVAVTIAPKEQKNKLTTEQIN